MTSWKAYCEKWGIDFNWDDFCLYAEKHLDGSGCVSAINPEEATLDQIREKSLTWQKMKDAISGNANWIISHRLGLEHQEYRRKKSEPTAAEETYPVISEILTEASEEEKSKESLMDAYDDLSSAVYALWDKNLRKHYAWSEVYAAAKSNWPAIADVMRYSPDDESEESLKFQIAVWKNFKKDVEFAVLQIEDLDSIESTDSWLLKKLIASEEAYEPPPSNGTGKIYAAYTDARRAYYLMMGDEPAQKVADKYWESFLAEAKKNAPRGYGLPRGNPTGEGDSVYDESSSKRIAGAWDWITEQCQASPHPDWLREWILETCCQMSSFAVVVHGRNFEGEIGRLEFQPSTLLSPENLERIVAATREAIDVELQEILAERQENQEAPKPQPVFKTVKYAKE